MSAVLLAVAGLALAACGSARKIEDASTQGCTTCHGSAENAAPPVSPLGASATSDLGVGAHQRHLRAGYLRGALACDDCHVVPDRVDAPGHIDGRAALAFGALATAHGAAPVWDRGAATCAATWCHGGTLGAGGSNTAPIWTAVNEGQTACGTCHGRPPPPPHPSNPACERCHPGTVLESGVVDAAGGRHIDGEIDAPALACNACHGSAANAAPPVASTGAESTGAVEVGAHQSHVRTGALRLALGCETCHVVPSAMLHADGTVDLAWSPLAGAVTWDRGAATCSTYCHGATLAAGGTNTLPVWTEVGSGQTACGTCHGKPPPAPHPALSECRRCHPDTVTAAGAIDVAGGRHVNGELDVTLGCSSCHGSDENAAPPIATNGDTATTEVAVGAHQAHVTTGAIRAALGCDACHAVPTTALHSNGTVDLAWSPLAGAVTWDRGDATCSTYCHGATLAAGGTNTLPVWTKVGEGQTACGTCHGNPPPAPHPANPACSRCHPDTVTAAGVIDVAGGKHVNGTLDLGPLGCSTCHGSDANAAPPIATNGDTATTALAVGAHQAHVTTGAIRTALGCDACHAVPTTALHSNGTVNLRWSALAGSVVWDRGVATCSTYCHGATLAAGGTNTLPVWTKVGEGQTACGTCHGAPPPSPHPASTACDGCHRDTVDGAGRILVSGGRHIDGTVELSGVGCSSCHGSDANPAPPLGTRGETATTAIAVGAHQAHVTSGAVRSALACGECHVTPSTLVHSNGAVDLRWGALAGPTTWDRGAATCATYCHGATLAAGGTNTTPVWTLVGAGQTACGTCHGRPPPPPHPSSPACARCHPDTVTAAGELDVAGGRHVNGAVDVGPLGCSSCHGSDANPAPPLSTSGESATTAIGVGAHQAHLADGALRRAVGCASCHAVPATALHADGTVDLAWSALAGSVTWDRSAATCSTYCHGATLAAGGTNTLPVWTLVGAGQTACGTCHGSPPPAPHPANPRCSGCHPETVDAQGEIDVLLGRHIDGAVQVAGLGCSSCHGSDANPAPPLSTTGESATTAVAVGAHQAHVTTGTIRAALGCDACHAVPATTLHADGTVDLSWSALAGSVTWDRGAATCSTYCHGATLAAGGTNTLPVWTDVGAGQTACGTCHGVPPPAPHPGATTCDGCHAGTVGADGRILVAGGRHVDGTVQLDGAGCTSCHGSSANPAPPVSTTGESATTAVAVGAHQAHVRDGALRTALACGDCHALPSTLLHSNGTVDLQWSALAGTVTWDRSAATCSTYCHGATLGAGGTNTRPVWTDVGSGQTACGTCHGAPPPSPHPANPLCNGCHPETVDPQNQIYVLLGRHIDGAVEVAGLGCSSCHGSEANPAPPVSTTGESATTAVAVGAHQAHVRGGAIRGALGCDACHALPSTTAHANGTVDLPWSPLAGAVVWDRTAATCSTYCHGATLDAGGSNTLPVWTLVGTGQAACGTCHGNPPPAPHPAQATCSGCHPGTVAQDGTILVAGGKHVDGHLDASGTCGACHGVPPASGAHRAHAAFADPSVPAYGDLRILEAYSPGGGPAYQFGCGHCHPLDPARHMDGAVEVDLSPAAPGAAGLRALNAADARFVPESGTCGGAYCHSSGQATPAFAATPAWTSLAPLGCDGCHGNPPAYPSGGAGAPDANGHLALTDTGREFGHYAGMAGPSHLQKHGGGAWATVQAAAPITCQTCHFETTDPSSTGPSGFYWLETSGRYALPGGDPARASDPAWRATQCATCHGEAGPAPAGSGRVLPLRHVNGRRDVVFDPRTALPPYAALPPAPDRPTRPYWLTAARLCEPLPAGAILEGSTLSLHLAGATWEPGTKRCSGVACHLGGAPVWGRPYRSEVAAPDASCCGCHANRCAR